MGVLNVQRCKKWLKLDVIQEQLQNKLAGGGRNTKTKGKRTKAKTRIIKQRREHLLIKM